MNTPGDRLRRGRTLKGLSQAELARMTGCAKSTISKLESNQIPDPRMQTVGKICSALEISIDWYWYGRGVSPDLPDKISKAVQKVIDNELRKES